METQVKFKIGDIVEVLPNIGIGKITHIRPAGAVVAPANFRKGSEHVDDRPLYRIDMINKRSTADGYFLARHEELKRLTYLYGEDRMAETVISKLTLAESYTLVSMPDPEVMMQALCQEFAKRYPDAWKEITGESWKVA